MTATNDRRVVDPTGALSARSEQFCREYIIDFIGTRAAARAGVPEGSAKVRASEMLCHPAVQARISVLVNERAQQTGLDANWVVTRLKTVAERCLQETPVTKDGKPVMITTATGEVAAAYTFDATGATRALDSLGKHLGIFEKDNAQRVPRGEAERIAAIDAEIEEMMNRGDTGNGATTRH